MNELALSARQIALERERERDAWLVWHIGKLSNADPKKYPRSPSDLLPNKSAGVRQDWADMDRASLSWVVNQGGAVQR